MRLEDKLTYLDNCLKHKNSHLHSSSQAEILKSCYFQIQSLRKTINHHNSIIVESTPTPLPRELPKIPSLPKASNLQDSIQSKSLLVFQENTFQNSFSKSSLPQFLNRSQREESLDHFLKEDQCSDKKSFSKNQLSSIISIKDEKQRSKRPEKENKIQKKVKAYRQRMVLGRDQRYFEEKEVKVDSSIIEKMGLYEAGNLFKTKNIEKNLQYLTIVAEKHEFNPVMLGNSCDLFVTNIQPGNSDFCVQTFIEEELGRHKVPDNAIQQCEQSLSSKTVTPYVQPIPEAVTFEATNFYLTFQGYEVLHDDNFKMFKSRHISQWGSVLLNIQKTKKCLKNMKINLIRVKDEHLLSWQGKKTTEYFINGLLGLKNNVQLSQRIEKTVLAFIDRLKVAVMKRRIQHRQNQIRWVAERLKAIYILRQRRKEKYEIVKKLQLELRDQLQWEVEIHIPSFSVDSFKRNTTQYMESLQAQYHCLWESSDYPLILVLPSINETLLRLIQNRLKLNRPVTIITPQLYSVFPPNLSLSAQVYFSYETLAKIEKAVDGRRAILIGSSYSDSKYEILISEYLRIPIMTSIKTRTLMQEEKIFFKQAKIKIADYCLIPAEVSEGKLLELFAELLMGHECEKTWVLKIKGEFKGRGIATVKLNPSKCFRKGINTSQTISVLTESLRNTLRLKLKVNFENSVYMVEDFLGTLRKEGGIIQEYFQPIATYEICFNKVRNCHLRSVFRVHGTNFSNKVWLSTRPDASLGCQIEKIEAAIQNNYNYLGFISVTICQTANQKYVGVDLKFGQSLTSSMSSFVNMIEAKRALQGTEALNVETLPTRRPSFEPGDHHHTKYDDNFRYLFIPAFPFTDVDEFGKSKLIQELMTHCWNDRHLRLGYSGKVFLSMGLDFSAVLMGRDLKRLKREGVDLVRELAEKVGLVREYRGKEVVRDVFQSGDVIRAISHIRAEE